MGHILALSTAVPPYILTQAHILEKIHEVFPMSPEEIEAVKKAYQNSGIEKRHLVTDDYSALPPSRKLLGEHYPKVVPGMAKRNDLYKEFAPKLALEAAKKAIEEWGQDPLTISHVISVSCTGVMAPGIEFGLIESLPLKRSVRRFGINLMGCFGAFKGLEVAHAFAKLDPSHRVLVVCTELCSLHVQLHNNPSAIMGNTLFADGAAAAIIGQSQEKALFEMVRHTSIGLENSKEHMGWEAGDHGFLMTLSHHVPIILARHIQAFTEELISPYAKIPACTFAIHPGGKAIIKAIEKKLGLRQEQAEASWETLANYGNMSSATFLFVLDALRKKASEEWVAGIGFGPGLSAEGILLRNLVT